MIAELLLLAALADKPYVVTWEVNYGGAIANKTFKRAFVEPLDATLFQLRAPKCKPPENKTPCVVWTRLDVVRAPHGLRTKQRKDRQ